MEVELLEVLVFGLIVQEQKDIATLYASNYMSEVAILQRYTYR
jgi:hypothetical protein